VILECIATSLADAIAIESSGGDRIELVSCLERGGFTPSDGLVRAVLDAVSIPVAVMLRPEQDSFHYSDNQLSVMRRDALRFQELGVRRIVTGILDEDGVADVSILSQVLEGTDFDVTFHRAIDESSDVAASLERINNYPRITHILTSLGQGCVDENLDRLPWYLEHARPRLILGSGITHGNIKRILQSLPSKEIDLHIGTALRFGKAFKPVDAVSLREFVKIVKRFDLHGEVPSQDDHSAQKDFYTQENVIDRALRVFKDAGFGLFIHFGLYSLLGGEYRGKETPFLAEWIRLSLDIPDDEYRQLTASFNPTAFDADRICELARVWGMKYICLTAKHHDGFALFDSSVDTFNSVALSPSGRDFVREMSEACARHNLLFCVYYSQAQDWDHPGGLRAYQEAPPASLFTQYLEEKCLPQLRELLTQYGSLAMIWLDTPMSMTPAQCRQIKDLIRSLQPSCLISGRIGCGLGDYITTGDNMLPRSAQTKLWELPATLNSSWGYKRSDHDWRTAKDVIHQLTKVVSRGGNLLLNIGPDGTGAIPKSSIDVLNETGEFLQIYGDAFYGTSACPDYPYEQNDFYLTGKPRHVYIHLRRLPANRKLRLYHVENQPTFAKELSTGIELEIETTRDLEGHACWNLDLRAAESALNRSLMRWGSAVIEVGIEEDTLQLSNF
jgi:alpha-L-fucosidase